VSLGWDDGATETDGLWLVANFCMFGRDVDPLDIG